MNNNNGKWKLLLQSLACLGLLLMLAPSGPQALAADNSASIFTFPHFVSFQDVSSGIAIFNPSSKAASVTLTLAGTDGHALGSPVTISVPAKGQIAKTAGELFTISGDLDASLVVSSATPGILAFYQTFDAGGTFLDGAESTSTDYTLIYPVVPGPQEGDSEIDILNPNVRPAAVELRLRSFGGDLLGLATVQIPAGGVYRALAKDAFPPGTSFTGASHVVATAKPLNVFSQAQTVAGTSLFSGFSSVAEPGGFIDIAALNAVPLTQLSTSGVLPYFRTGSQTASILTLANAEPAAVDVDLTAIGNNGSTLGTRRITLKPNGGYRSLLQGVFSVLASGEREGWILLHASGRVFGGMIHGRSDAASLAAIPMQTSPKFDFVVPQVLQGSGFYMELALVNPGTSASFADIYAAKANGDTIGSTRVTLGPGARMSQRLDQLLPEVVSQSGGYIYVHASDAWFGAALIGSDSGALLTNVGCLPLAVSFTPAPQKSFYIAGKVTLDDNAGAGFQIVLTGPVNGTATSAADGSYQFKDLPAGKYSMTIVYPDSLEFAPPSTSFEITTANKRQDFQGFTKPSVWGIITMNDRPSAGFRVKLSGPVSLSAVSAADGSYLFKSLSGGNYTLAIEYESGIQFVPSYVSFDLARVSKRQDFVGSTEPNVIVLRPPALPVASPDTSVTIFGNGFNETSRVFVDLLRLKTTFVDSTQLKAVIPAYMLAQPLRFSLTVTTNPGSSDQWTATPFTFLVYQDSPTLASVTASDFIVEGGPDALLTLTGSGFLNDTKVKINGISDGIGVTLVSATTIIADVPASYFAHGGVYPISVQNDYPASIESNIQLLTVYYAAPAVQGVQPNAVSARLELSADPLDIDVTGYGFRRGAVVLLNDVPLTTTYCESNAYCLTVHLYAKIPPSMLRSSGFAEIAVRNPEPSLARSETVFLRIDGLQPTITSVLPGSATALELPDKFSVPIVVNGTNFGPQTTVRVYKDGTDPLPPFVGTLTLIGSTQLVTNVLIDSGSTGSWVVEVDNPQPGGGKSDPANFFISSGSLVDNPFLISLNPDTVSSGASSFTLTIKGTNFKNGARVQFKSTLLATNVIDDQDIQAAVPDNLLLTAGRAPISVINPDNGGTSNRLYLDIK